MTARVEDRIRFAAAPLLRGLTKPQTGAVLCLLLGMVMLGTPHLATIATYLAQQEVIELGLNALTVTARVEPERNRRGRRRRKRSPDRAASERGQRLPLVWETYRAEGEKGSAEKETYQAVMTPLLQRVGPGVPLMVAHDRGYSGMTWFSVMDRVFESAPDATWCVLEGNRIGGRHLGLRGRDNTQRILKVREAVEEVKCDRVFWHHDPTKPDDDARVRVGFRSVWLIEKHLPADEDGRRRGVYQAVERTLAVVKCPKLFKTANGFAFLLGRRVRGMAWAKRVFLSFHDRNLREDTHRAAGEFFDIEEIRVWKRFKAYSRLARLAMLAQRIICELNLHPSSFRTRCLKKAPVMGADPSRDYTYRLMAGIRYLLFRARLRGPWWEREAPETVTRE